MPNSKVNPTKPTPTESRARHLFSLSRKLATSPDALQADAWAEKLYAVIERCVKKGEEQPLSEALQLATEADEETAFDELRSAYEIVASTRVVEMPEGNLAQAIVYAVPLTVAAAPTHCFPTELPANAAFDQVAKSFRTYGVISPNAAVMLSPHLYSAQDLADASYHQVYRMNDYLRDKLRRALRPSRRTAPRNPLLPQPVAADEGASNTPVSVMLSTKFLLMLVLEEMEDEFEVSANAEATWERAVRAPLTALLGGEAACQLWPFPPAPFYSGVQAGITATGDFFTLQQTKNVLQAHGMEPAGAEALIAVCADEDNEEVRISIASRYDGTLLDGVSCKVPPFDTVDEAVARTVETMEALGLHSVTVLDGTYPLASCPDCGAPVFVTAEGDPWHKDSADSDFAVPYTGLLH